jgi:predicted dehydrogenase
MIKIGLIGAGFMGSTHAACYEALSGKYNFQVNAVADANEENARALAAKFGAKVYLSGEELIAMADVNTIDICLPTFLHTEHALLAMKKGYDVFIEKPVCLHETEAKALLEAQKISSSKVMIGHCLRFWPEYMYLKQIQDDHMYGELISAVFKRISPEPAWGWEQWTHDVNRSGTVALDLHIHDVDFVRYLWGNPDYIKSETLHLDGNLEHIFSIYRYNEAVVTLEGTWYYPSAFPFEMEYRVKFAQATVVFNSTKVPSLHVYCNDGSKLTPTLEEEVKSTNSESHGNISALSGYYNELNYFLECLANGKEIENATLEDGIQSFLLTKQGIEVASKRSFENP